MNAAPHLTRLFVGQSAARPPAWPTTTAFTILTSYRERHSPVRPALAFVATPRTRRTCRRTPSHPVAPFVWSRRVDDHPSPPGNCGLFSQSGTQAATDNPHVDFYQRTCPRPPMPPSPPRPPPGSEVASPPPPPPLYTLNACYLTFSSTQWKLGYSSIWPAGCLHEAVAGDACINATCSSSYECSKERCLDACYADAFCKGVTYFHTTGGFALAGNCGFFDTTTSGPLEDTDPQEQADTYRKSDTCMSPG